MNKAKADFFNNQTGADWAADEYGPDELNKLNVMFNAAGPLNGCRVIEPGCGTGRLTEILAEKVGDTGNVFAFDISRGMIEAARIRLDDKRNVHLSVESLETLPLPPETADAVICHQVFPHFDDKPIALKIMFDALKPGGRLVVFHFISLAIINDRHRKAGTAVENDMMPPEDEMRALFERAGFKIDLLSDSEDHYLLCAVKEKR